MKICPNCLKTYSENEKQENIINKNNASLINYADFYPLYTWFMYSDLSLTECVILSYLYYWTKNWKWIYTSNDELARLTKSSRAVITKVLKHLSDLWYIDMKIKRIVWAWTDRKMKINVEMMKNLINNTNSDHTELISSSQTTQNEQSDYSNWVAIKDLYNTNKKNYIINNNTEFENEVLNGKGIALVDLFADWCMPCQMIAPIIEEISNEKTDVNFFKVNVDETPEVAIKYGVSSIPTLLIFKDGELVNKAVGAYPKEKIIELLEI